MDNFLFEQLVQRIQGDRKALQEASDIFRGMIDRKAWQDLTRQREVPLDIGQLEQVFTQQQIFFRQIRLEGKWWNRCTGKLLAFTVKGDRPRPGDGPELPHRKGRRSPEKGGLYPLLSPSGGTTHHRLFPEVCPPAIECLRLYLRPDGLPRGGDSYDGNPVYLQAPVQ